MGCRRLCGGARTPALDQAARRQPGRALGVAWFAVDRGARALQVELAAPAQIRPRGTLKLPIRIAGLSAGEQARVGGAADVGILNLTRPLRPIRSSISSASGSLHRNPRPLRLSHTWQGTRGSIRSGGDMGGAIRLAADPGAARALFRHRRGRTRRHGGGRIRRPVLQRHGLRDGGRLDGDRVGHARADVVRDPVVSGGLPRFLSVGDQSRFFMQIDNVEGPAGDYTINLDINGPIVACGRRAAQRVRLEERRATVTVPIAAAGIGTATVDTTVTGAGFEASDSRRIQPGSSLVRRVVRPLPNGESLTVSADLLADIPPGTGAVSVSASPLAALDVPGLLQALDRYPGCRADREPRPAAPLCEPPLRQEALAPDEGIDERVRQSIERVLSRQDSAGSFGLWSPGGGDLWLAARDRLTRARERGFGVPQKASICPSTGCATSSSTRTT